jgi:hypothetical protein
MRRNQGLMGADKVSSLFSTYRIVNDPVISDFISSIPETFSGAVENLSHAFTKVTTTRITSENRGASINMAPTADSINYVNDYKLNNRLALGDIVKKFHHEADTLSSQVSTSIGMLSHPATKIFVSTHQPNLFAYGGIFKKIVLLQTLKNTLLHQSPDSLRIVNLFIIIDHDFMDENWIRVTQLPSIRHSSGIFEVRLPVNNSRRWQMVCNMPLPRHNILDDWKNQLISWIRNSTLFDSFLFPLTTTELSDSSSESSTGDIKSKLIDNLKLFWEHVELSYSRAKSYADLNAFLMSTIVNTVWGYDTLFVRLTDLSPIFLNGYTRLLSNFDIYSDTLRKTHYLFQSHGIPLGVSPSSYLNAPVWLHCRCGSKAPTKLNRSVLQREGELLLEGVCMACKKSLTANLGKKQLYEKNEPKQDSNSKDAIAHNLSPRAIPIPLLLLSELGMSCYASGTDGMRYIIFGSHLFKQFSSNNAPLFLVWPAKDNYRGFAQVEALNLLRLKQRLSNVTEYIKILNEKLKRLSSLICPLIEERNRLVKSGQPIERILSKIFSLKEMQRSIRSSIKTAEKVKRVMDMRPSIIDYVVNFGLEDTESQWRQTLLDKDSLSASIDMVVS